ncbi:hypothetical protein [Aeromonas aquatica]|uniref:hypothetical protein n=1 Tax=Aeromonas aquatica TaxID=558964 RepID=UPI00286F96CD|nr:hypothetical protein [Aeromonas aquatica]
MNMTTLIDNYQQAKRERDELDEQIRTLRSNRAQLQQRLTETEAKLATGQQGRVDELLQGKDNAKTLNKAVGLTLFAQDAKQALAASEQNETELYLPLCDAQQRLDSVVQQMTGHYLAQLESKGLASVEKGLDEALLPLANLVKVKGELQGLPLAKQWAMAVLSRALDRSLEQATGVFAGDVPEAWAILTGHNGSAFPDVTQLGATPAGRHRLRQSQPLPL